ncbi:hypothetical protein [Moheibacter sediminis]|uniref:DUF4834 domain-containing protein n=1 Tax=Moheibacter sediminis TaxID=1434700 RepID=A0A1W1ZBF1_9FLAO|nr:hypothetical protein [Moheibacter sediminis]SMC45740.1 hypothetical protein SAMN06296427_102355 [Moheibacter sediminis]
MSLLKFVFYSLVAYLVIRMVVRIFFTPKRPQQNPFSNPNQNQNRSQTYSNSESLEKPKFTIEAESVDYEVIEEKDEKK